MSWPLKKQEKYILLFLVTAVILLLIISNISTVLKMVYPLKYKEYVIKYSQQYDLDPYLVFSMIKAESNFDEKAMSHKNARGLMQITEDTGKWIAQKVGEKTFNTDDLFNPELNIRFGCYYLKHLKEERFKNNTDLAIMAYNAGEGNVGNWVEQSGGSGLTYEQIPFKETRNYLKKVKDYSSIYKKLYEKII